MLDTHFLALVKYSDSTDLASFDQLGYNAITVEFPLLAFGSILWAGRRPRDCVIRPRDWTKLDSLQVLTKWLDVTPKGSLCNWIV